MDSRTKRQSEAMTSLLSLPDCLLSMIAKQAQSCSLRPVCKKLAQTLLDTRKHKLRLGKQAKWEGIRQVLAWGRVGHLQLDLGSLEGGLPSLSRGQESPAKALTILVGSLKQAFYSQQYLGKQCQFSSITCLTIDLTNDHASVTLPWLVPPVVVACCPNLRTLHLTSPKFANNLINVRCTSLTTLTVRDWTHHTLVSTDQMRYSLPNIENLQLETDMDYEEVNDLGEEPHMDLLPVLMPAWRETLRTLLLSWCNSLDDDLMQHLISLPRLTKLAVGEISVTRDWRPQASHLRWEEFHMGGINFNWLAAGWLPLQHLQSMTADGCVFVLFPSGLELHTARSTACALMKAAPVFADADVCLDFTRLDEDEDAAQVLRSVKDVFHSTQSSRQYELRATSDQILSLVTIMQHMVNKICISNADHVAMEDTCSIVEQLGNHCQQLVKLSLRFGSAPDDTYDAVIEDITMLVSRIAELAHKQVTSRLWCEILGRVIVRLRNVRLIAELLPSVTGVPCGFEICKYDDRLTFQVSK